MSRQWIVGNFTWVSLDIFRITWLRRWGDEILDGGKMVG